MHWAQGGQLACSAQLERWGHSAGHRQQPMCAWGAIRMQSLTALPFVPPRLNRRTPYRPDDFPRNVSLFAQVDKKGFTACSEQRPEECEALRYALFACRRGQVDARSRIQGNKGY